MGAVLKAVIDAKGIRHLRFECPGCDAPHMVPVTGDRAWAWNGSEAAPTFAPSILVRFHREGVDEPGVCGGRCHSFVTDGRVQFLCDSTHALAGQTVHLPALCENAGA